MQRSHDFSNTWNRNSLWGARSGFTRRSFFPEQRIVPARLLYHTFTRRLLRCTPAGSRMNFFVQTGTAGSAHFDENLTPSRLPFAIQLLSTDLLLQFRFFPLKKLFK